MQRGELGERETTEGRELFLLAERGPRWVRGRIWEKQPLQSNWRESRKVEAASGTELKR